MANRSNSGSNSGSSSGSDSAPDRDAASRRSFWARTGQKVAALVIWGSLAAVLWWYLRTTGLTLSAFFLRGLAWAQASPLAPLLYILIYAVRPLTLFSATLLTVAGGFLFGPLWGVGLTMLAANISASVAYVIGRFFGRGVLSDEQSAGLLQRYADRLRRHSFATVLIMRFIYLPFDLVSYLAGFLSIRYLSFMLATILGTIPGTIAFVLLGAAASPQDVQQLFLTGRLPTLDLRVLALSLVMFVASLVLARLLRRRETASPAG